MSRAYQYAYAARWILLVLGVICLTVAVLMYLSEVSTSSAEDAVVPLLILAAFFFTQWLFLLPRRGWTIRLSQHKRPMKTSIALGAIIMAFLSFGVFMTLWELLVERGGFEMHGGVCVAVIAGMWLMWTIAFYLRWRKRAVSRYSALSSMMRWMLSGTIAELLIAAPVNAFVHDPDDCECARGSFYGLCLGILAMLWIFGPGIVLLFLQERQRRLSSSSLCLKCGYDLRGTLLAGRDTCPECGATADKLQIGFVNWVI
jgi:hypothetical protein